MIGMVEALIQGVKPRPPEPPADADSQLHGVPRQTNQLVVTVAVHEQEPFAIDVE